MRRSFEADFDLTCSGCVNVCAGIKMIKSTDLTSLAGLEPPINVGVNDLINGSTQENCSRLNYVVMN